MRREYARLLSQARILLGTAALSFALFLLFSLPLGALAGLTIVVASLGAGLLVAAAALKAWYRLEMSEHPLGLVRRLPAAVQTSLIDCSLHDCLARVGSQGSLGTLGSLGSLGSLTRDDVSSRGSTTHGDAASWASSPLPRQKVAGVGA